MGRALGSLTWVRQSPADSGPSSVSRSQFPQGWPPSLAGAVSPNQKAKRCLALTGRTGGLIGRRVESILPDRRRSRESGAVGVSILQLLTQMLKLLFQFSGSAREQQHIPNMQSPRDTECYPKPLQILFHLWASLPLLRQAPELAAAVHRYAFAAPQVVASGAPDTSTATPRQTS